MREIVVGVDGSEESRHALDRALHLGQVTGRQVVVTHAWTEPVAATSGLGFGYLYDVVGAREDARLAAAELVDRELADALPRLTDDAHLRFRDLVAPGSAGSVLTTAGKDAGLIVLGTREHGRLLTLLGSSVTYALHHATCPVLVVPRHGDATQPFSRVVVGVDGSVGSRAALRWALDVAARDHAPVEVLQVLDEDQEVPADPVEALRPTVPEIAVGDLHLRVIHGHAGLILAAAVGPQDLLVVGSRGTGRFAALVLGSVSAHCVTSPRAAVAVVRAGEDRLEDLEAEAAQSRRP